ncbi:zinc finger protein 436 isoform X2 [Drosophila mojavensis]|nr:zinc finger protein 436 isoform X2 [Drosophila mojavensis]
MSDLRTLCRTCGITINTKHDTKLFEEFNYHLVTLLEDITDMLIENDIAMPEHICITCKSMLDQIVKFRSNCLSTHKKLIAVKMKNLQSNILAPESRSKVNIVFDNIEYDTTESSKTCDEQQATTNLGNDIHRYSKASVDVPAKRTPQVKNKRIYKSKEAKTWICEQCGGEFKCSTYLKLHMLRHTGTKKFECDICKRGYYTKNEMERHKILHTNARPYACRFCDKTFRGTSSKTVHERAHTNERPFVCQYCDKTFRSTSL